MGACNVWRRGACKTVASPRGTPDSHPNPAEQGANARGVRMIDPRGPSRLGCDGVAGSAGPLAARLDEDGGLPPLFVASRRLATRICCRIRCPVAAGRWRLRSAPGINWALPDGQDSPRRQLGMAASACDQVVARAGFETARCRWSWQGGRPRVGRDRSRIADPTTTS